MQRIKSFGCVEVRDQDGELLSFRSRKHVGLLVYLRSNPRRVHLRENVARLFWETESSLARHSLSQALYDIRSTLGQVITNVPGDALRMEADRVAFDVDELEHAVKTGDLLQAVDLYTAAFAPDLDRAGTGDFERWLERERSRLAVLGQSALRQFLTYADNRGEWGEMCSAALRLIRMNPLDEEAHRALMRGLWLHGDQTSALEHFREVRERLEGELPQGLSDETLELVQRIERSRPRAVGSEIMQDRSIPLVGRQRELAILGEFADEPPECNESLVIQGEAGIGKTRLVGELEKLLTLKGYEILTSQCYAAEAEVAYGPVLDGLREVATGLDELPGSASYLELGRLFPSVAKASQRPLDAPADGQSARRRLFEEIADMLRRYAGQKPVVWIVEDVHHIDGASSALLHYVARRLSAHPFRLVLTTRTESDQSEGARKLLSEEAFVDRSRRCEVSRLSVESIGEIVRAMRGDDSVDRSLVEKVAGLSGGNPFYAVELLRLDAELHTNFDSSSLFKGRLRAVLRTRLQGLASDEVRFLEAVAVVSPYARPSYLCEMCGFDWADVSRLSEALCVRGLLKEEAQTLRFSHEITREFVYSNIGLVARSALHLQAAELLANDRHTSPSKIARHFSLGGDALRAFEYAMQGTKVALSKAGFSEAADMAALALEVASNQKQRLSAWEALSDAKRAAGLLEDACSGLEVMIRSVDRGEKPRLWLEYNFRLLGILIDRTKWDEAKSLVEEIDRFLNRNESTLPTEDSVQFRLDSQYLSLIVRSKSDSRIDEIAANVKDTLESNDGSIPSQVLIDAKYSLAGYAAFYRSAVEARDQLLAILADENGLSAEQEQKCQLFLGGIHTKLGNWDKASHHLNKALRLTTSRHDVVDESAVLNNIGCLHLELGRWQEAEGSFSRAVSLQDVPGASLSTRLHSDLNLANIYFYRGMPKKANEGYRECLSFAEKRGLHAFKPELSACVGLTAIQCGDFHKAAESAKYLRGICETQLRGIQERYKVDWYLHYIASRVGSSMDTRSLCTLARRIEDTDPISALKLRWLNSLIGEESNAKEKLLEKLKEKNLYWFAGFSRRWLQSANASMKRMPKTDILHRQSIRSR